MGKDTTKSWTIEDSIELYNIRSWGSDFFSANSKGNIQVLPGTEHGGIDLKCLVHDLTRRGINPPIIVRFSDILKHKVEEINYCFMSAIKEYGYNGEYRAVFPIKTNQQKQVCESVLKYGTDFQYGLEVGSKSELIAALSMIKSGKSFVICNGYKDEEYLELVLYSQKSGLAVIPVIEKYTELEKIMSIADALDIKPRLGIRSRLSSKGSGRWEASTGDRSKFGLSATELLASIDYLKERKMLDALELLHFHLGSQISNIRSIKDSIEEASRIYIELAGKGVGLKYIDVGGGLGVDYDGSKTVFQSSINYTMQEYANDIVAGIIAKFEDSGVKHPTIISESGRAVIAYHSVVVVNVIGASSYGSPDVPTKPDFEIPSVIENFYEIYSTLTTKNFQEFYHDAVHAREEALALFKLGYLSLEMRSLSDRLFWGICKKILKIARDLEYVPEELEGLERAMSDIYFCNFSVFQSVPDIWAVGHLFPVLPIHRLDEEPTKRATIADITCDSDGKIDKFIDLHDVKNVIELHKLNGEPYYLGIFMTGAYQETLGDFHNLFGDINAVHVSLDPDGGYRIEHVVEGESVGEILSYVDYHPKDCMRALRDHLEEAVRAGKLTLEDSADFKKLYSNGLDNYPYLNHF